MADALIQKIEEDFLSCCICFEELRDPIGLPCLHGFCFKCLDAWSKNSKDKTQVMCPACNTPAPMPKAGIRGFPKHFLVKNLRDTVDMNKTTEAANDVNCSTCGKTAEMHCTDCKKSLCQECLTLHGAFTKEHMVVTVEELKSGYVTDEGRYCGRHSEQIRYYCETEQKQVCVDCISLKTCPVEHDRVTLKEAAKKHASSIDDLVSQCTDTKMKFQDAAKDVKMVMDDLTKSKESVKIELQKLKSDYLTRVEHIFRKHKSEIDKLAKERVRELEGKMCELRAGICEVEEACKQGTQINRSRSAYLITNKYSSLSKKLNVAAQSEPAEVDQNLGYLKFEARKWEIPLAGYVLQRKRWKYVRQILTEGLIQIDRIALSGNGDIAVGCSKNGVKLYSNRGEVRYILYDSGGAPDVVLTPDNRYVIAPLNSASLQFYSSQGKRLSISTTTGVNNQPSNVNTLAVDTIGRIIVGLADNAIAIHHADGSLISKFATSFKPCCLAVTSNGEIVSCFYDIKLERGTFLQMIDYSGSTVTVIQSPAEVKTWRPGNVCCSHGELFVVNEAPGDPTGVYRYTAEGSYLGCVTTEVNDPTGIALSKDGMELFVAEQNYPLVKIFHR